VNRLKQLYNEAKEEYDQRVSLLDRTLYRLCKKHPHHATKAEIHAKVWIIGRTYGTGIERIGSSTGKQGGVMQSLVKRIWTKRKRVHEIIAPLVGLKHPLDERKLNLIVEQHAKLLRLISPRSKKQPRSQKQARSFVSKYLHCHIPLVPIFDSVAAKYAPKLCRFNSSMYLEESPNRSDLTYYKHCCRVLQLSKELRQFGIRPKVRIIDRMFIIESR